MNPKGLERRLRIGLVGCGNMGRGLVRGLVEKSFYPQNIQVTDIDPRKASALRKEASVKVARSARQIASICDAIVLAVKPQAITGVVDEISLCTPKTALVISIAAGVRIADLQKGFREKVPIIRVMPNMPAQVGEGMSAYALGPYAGPAHEKIAAAIFSAVGEAVAVKEGLMDLVTAVSGSGPAYFFLLAQVLIEAACELGMKSEIAKQLVYQTAVGSVKTMSVTREDPETLIERVASKGGTTEAALRVFRSRGFGKIAALAVEAAMKRSAELSRQKGKS